MKRFIFFFALAMVLGESTAFAYSRCSNNVCGTIVCAGGCVQQAVNGRCIANYCTGRQQSTDLLSAFDRSRDEQPRQSSHQQ